MGGTRKKKEVIVIKPHQSPSNKQGRSEMKNNVTLDVRDEKMEGGIINATGSTDSTSKKTVSKSKMTQRLIHRNLPFCQSKNFVSVTNQYGKHRDAIYKLFRLDWFHVFLRLNTMLSVTILLLIWTVQILIFAALYVAVDGQEPSVDCGLGVISGVPMTFTEAFAFSLETVTTVGYTLPGSSMAFFQNCPATQVTIYFQMVFSMMFNAFLFAFFYNRLARCEARATLVLFSEKAVVRVDSTGKMVLEVQVYDSDSRHPVVEAHVRLILVPGGRSNRHNYNYSSPIGNVYDDKNEFWRLEKEQETTATADAAAVDDTTSIRGKFWRSENYRPLRIYRPNDEFNSPLFTSIPSRITHHIDSYSPLMPLKCRDKSIVESYGLPLRELDSWTGNREGYPCPVCGETFGTHERLWKHITYNQLVEQSSNIKNGPGTHQSIVNDNDEEDGDSTSAALSRTNNIFPTYEDIKQFWVQTGAELVAIVEGIDPLTSGTFQALQSYQADDVVFGGRFSPCFTDNNNVEFNLFHKTLPVPESKKMK